MRKAARSKGGCQNKAIIIMRPRIYCYMGKSNPPHVFYKIDFFVLVVGSGGKGELRAVTQQFLFACVYVKIYYKNSHINLNGHIYA